MKTDELKAIVDAQCRHYHAAMVRTAVIYLVLIVAVAAYTGYIFHSIRNTATPENAAALVFDRLESFLPEAAGMLDSNAAELGAGAAEKTVSAIADAIPEAGRVVRDFAGSQCDALCGEVEKNAVPVIQQHMETTLDNIFANPDVKFDDTMGDRISEEICDGIGRELDDMLDEHFYGSIHNMGECLVKFAGDSKLTKQEQSEKMFLVCWLYLTRHAEMCDDSVGAVVNAVNQAAGKFGFAPAAE